MRASQTVLIIPARLMKAICTHGEEAYPDEGAGLLLGTESSGERQVEAILPLDNHREAEARHRRYLLSPRDYLKGEREAERRGLKVLGVFHSHPDHPDQPSTYDLDWAMPWFSYLITSILNGTAAGSRSWRLTEDRSNFEQEPVKIFSQARS